MPSQQAREAIAAAFAERPSEREVALAAEKAQEAEQRSSGPDRDRDQEGHVEAEAGPERPIASEFAREGELESAPQARSLPVRYRRTAS